MFISLFTHILSFLCEQTINSNLTLRVRELSMSAVIICCFLLRSFQFRHSIIAFVVTMFGYGIVLIDGSIRENNYPSYVVSVIFCYYFIICILIIADGYMDERKQREHFSYNLKICNIVKTLSNIDITNWEHLTFNSQPNTLEHHLKNLVNRVQELRLYLPPALVQSQRNPDAIFLKSSLRQSNRLNASKGSTLMRDITGFPHENSELDLLNNNTLDQSALGHSIFNGGFAIRDVSILVIQIPFTTPLPSSISKGGNHINLNSLYSLHTEFIACILDCVDATDGVALVLGGSHLVVSWNAYATRDQHCYFACKCALTIHRKLSEQGIPIGHMAVTCGPCIIGGSGNNKVRTPIMIGGSVELALSLSQLNTTIGTSILISQDVFELIEPSFVVEIVDYVGYSHITRSKLDDGNGRIAIYELVSFKTPNRPIQLNKFDLLFKQAFVDLTNRKYVDAENRFLEYLNQSVYRRSSQSKQDPNIINDVSLSVSITMHKHPARLKQAIRLYKLSMYFKQNYTQTSWQCWEETSSLLMLPSNLSNLETFDYNLEEGPIDELSFFKNHTVKLREELARTYSPSSSTPSSPIETKKNDYHSYLNRSTSSELNPRTYTLSSTQTLLLQSFTNIRHENPVLLNYSFPKTDDREKRELPYPRLATIAPPILENRSTSPIIAPMDLFPINTVESHGTMEFSPSAMKRFVDCDGKIWKCSDIKLGEGAFGSVYLGMSQLGQLVAVKKMKANVDPKLQEEMLNEIRLLVKFRNDNIVSYLGSAVVSRCLIVILEYVSGGSLAYILEHFGPLPPSSVSQYSRHILRGLNYLHSNGVVHRDVKPANLLLDESGRCKLADFGTADHLNNIKKSVKGTPMYMAPEALKGCEYLPSSDIWSFGLTTLQLLTARLPWSIINRNENYLINKIYPV
eukprot:NODE_242_length_3166_cov_37.850477_g196_i1.p1 GENE.NODE_242_length_3166_cov_37.850477_g196_i1~~NODE_242_length_3166_cov_37.850477_g196_i1.p1  ORF type:complete len:935 (+),score=137.66 NODE_242_length_3166_cov_37.850477_g196_i1:68-2806(+)